MNGPGPVIQQRALCALEPPALAQPDAVHCQRAERYLHRLPRLREAQARLGDGRAGDGAALETMLALRHPLCARMAPPADWGSDDRSHAEFASFAQALPRYLAFASRHDAAAMLELLVAIDAGAARGAVRRTGMSLEGVSASAMIRFEGADAAGQRLAWIAATLAAARPGLPGIAFACWAYVLLLNAHPFSDGNGRVARILFNLELARMGMPAGSYLPIFLAMRRSAGGYEIKLREAEIQARWRGIVRFMCDAILIAAGAATMVADCIEGDGR